MYALILLTLSGCFAHLGPEAEVEEESVPWNATYDTREPASPDLGNVFDARLADCEADQLGTDDTTREYRYDFDSLGRVTQIEYADDEEADRYESTEKIYWNDDNCVEQDSFSYAQAGESHESENRRECDEHGNPTRSIVEEDGEIASETEYVATYADERLVGLAYERVDGDGDWEASVAWEFEWDGNYWSQATQRNTDEQGESVGQFEYVIEARPDGRLEKYEQRYCYDRGEKECGELYSERYEYDSNGVVIEASGAKFDWASLDPDEGTIETELLYEWTVAYASDGKLIPSRAQVDATFANGDELVLRYEYELDCK